MPTRHDDDPLAQAVLAGVERGFDALGKQVEQSTQALSQRFDDLKEALLALQTQTDRAINRTMRVQLAAQGGVFLLVIFVIAGFMMVAGVDPGEAARAVEIIAQVSKTASPLSAVDDGVSGDAAASESPNENAVPVAVPPEEAASVPIGSPP